MINIRKNLFETNSSSSHSIVVTNKPIKENTYYFCVRLNKDRKMTVDEDDLFFGRHPFKFLCTFYTKVCYAIASCGKHGFSEIEEIVKKYAKSYTGLSEQCAGIELPKIYKKNTYFYGDIDHQSCGLLAHFLSKENITLEEFLINPKYTVIIDGDEYCVFFDMINTGLIDSSQLKIY